MITVRLTPEADTRVRKEAMRLGLTRAGYVHHLIENKSVRVETPTDPDVLPVALINELKRIGNNLNQIAHAANSGLPPSQRMTAGALQELLNEIVQNELLNRRSHVLRTRAFANDSAPPQTRAEFQRSVQLHPARRGDHDG
jgi:hypothetical protein